MSKEEEEDHTTDLRLSPTPKYTSEALTLAIIETRKDTKFLREDLLPPLMIDTKEARDKAREALVKVDDHIDDKDAHEHPCVEGGRQLRQDDKIFTHDEKLEDLHDIKPRMSSLSKIVWAALAVFTGIVGGSYGYTLMLNNITTENATKIEGQQENITRHEMEINSLEAAQQRDREIYLREVRALPENVREVAQKQAPTLEDVAEVARNKQIKMTERERDMMKLIVKQATKRGVTD